MPNDVRTIHANGIEFAGPSAAQLTHERSRVEIVDGVGRFLQLEDPTTFNGLVLDFLAG